MAYRDEVIPVSITDLDSKDGELQTVNLQSNPESLSKSYAAVYVEHAPVGFTGTHKNFVGNKDIEFPLICWYHATNRAEYAQLIAAKNFLESLTYPGDATDIKTNAPPKIMVTWPNNFSMVCRVETMTIDEQQFDRTGQLTMFTAVLNLFSVADKRLVKSSIKKIGIVPVSDLVEI